MLNICNLSLSIFIAAKTINSNCLRKFYESFVLNQRYFLGNALQYKSSSDPIFTLFYIFIYTHTGIGAGNVKKEGI